MSRFIEVQQFGLNLLTGVFIMTLIFTIIQAYALFKQNREIKSTKSGKSVSFVFFSYYCFSALAVIIYGFYKNSLALTINGLIGFIALSIIIKLWRYKKITGQERILSLLSVSALPLIIFVPQKDLLFFIFGLIISAALVMQIYEIRHNCSVGSVRPEQAVVSILSNSFWLSYALVMHIWPLQVINSLGLILWIVLLLSYRKYKKEEMARRILCRPYNLL